MDLVIVEVNGVDTRRLSYEETLALLSNPPNERSDGGEADKKSAKSEDISSASHSETSPKNDPDTITIKVMRRVKEESVSLAQKSSQEFGSEKNLGQSLEDPPIRESPSPGFERCRNHSDVDRRKTKVTSHFHDSFTKVCSSVGGKSEKTVEKKSSGAKATRKIADCSQPETNQASQPPLSNNFTYELLDSEEEGRLLQKLDLEQRPASDNRIMHKDLYQSSFQKDVTEVTSAENYANISTYVNLEDIRKLLETYNSIEEKESSRQQTRKSSRNSISKAENIYDGCFPRPSKHDSSHSNDKMSGETDTSSRFYGKLRRRFPTSHRLNIKPKQFLPPNADNRTSNFTSHSAPHSPLHQSYDSFINDNLYSRPAGFSRTRTPQVRIEMPPSNDKFEKYPFIHHISNCHQQPPSRRSHNWGSLDYTATTTPVRRRGESFSYGGAYVSSGYGYGRASAQDRRDAHECTQYCLAKWSLST